MLNLLSSAFRDSSSECIPILDYTYTSEPSIHKAKPLVASKLRVWLFWTLSVLSLGLLWLICRWSARRKAFWCFQSCSLEIATHFLIMEEDQGSVGTTIVLKLDKYELMQKQVLKAFIYQERTYVFYPEKQVFVPIRCTLLGYHLEKLRANKYVVHSAKERSDLLQYYGVNRIQIPVRSRFEIFLDQMLTPYEVFQSYCILLWIYEKYYLFSVVLLLYALYTNWTGSSEIAINQCAMRNQWLIFSEVKVQIRKPQSEDAGVSTERRLLSHQFIPFDPIEDSVAQKVVDSSSLVPGDILLMHSGSIVPCDCIILEGECLVDQGYVFGQNQLSRKRQLDNYVFTFEYEQCFTLQLGARIQRITRPRAGTSDTIRCLVSNTHYMTERGKYLRAIRHHRKQGNSFNSECIRFLYGLLAFTTVIYLWVLPGLVLGGVKWQLIIFRYFDMLALAIPPTLPTALSVGVNFASHRLKKLGIIFASPRNLIVGGSVDTIVLHGANVFGSNYTVDAIVIGCKRKRQTGIYFQTLAECTKFMLSSTDNAYCDLIRTTLYAMSTCHTVQFKEGKMTGSSQETAAFTFASGSFNSETEISCQGTRLKIQRRLFCKQLDKMFGVAITDLSKPNELMLFYRGECEKLIPLCMESTYPLNLHEYVQDMAEKGFSLIAYACLILPLQHLITFQLTQFKGLFTFLGINVLSHVKEPKTEEAIKILRKAGLHLMYVAEAGELQTGSRAVSHGISSKRQLISCTYHPNSQKVIVKGQTEWSSQGLTAEQQFLNEIEENMANSTLALNGVLYERLFMREHSRQGILRRIVILNNAERRHARNIYQQLERYGNTSLVIGAGKGVAEEANLSLQPQNQASGLLNGFSCKFNCLQSAVDLLLICRAGLSANFQCFSMMILFSLVQFTTVILLMRNYQSLNSHQTLFIDLGLTFPVFVTLNLTRASKHLSKQRPASSFLSLQPLLSMLGQFALQLCAQHFLLRYLLSLQQMQLEREQSLTRYLVEGELAEQTMTSACLFVMSNYLYLGIVLSTSVSRPFRRPFYTNPYYTLNLVLLWCYATSIVVFPDIVPSTFVPLDRTEETHELLVVSMLVGNLTMTASYFYENFLTWALNISRSSPLEEFVEDQQ